MPYFLRDLYKTKAEFLLYDRLYGISEQLGFDSPDKAWAANPPLNVALPYHTTGGENDQ